MKIGFYFIVSFFILCVNLTQSQCVDISCNSNTGLFSNDNASEIAYDNMGAAFHSTFIKEPNGTWKVWGEYLGNDGTTNVLSPLSFNNTNYPALTGTIYKMAIGSSFGLNVQLIVLTSDGLFVLGTEGAVIDDVLTTSSEFQKITVDGKTDGLPQGVTPQNVKMMFASAQTLIITTCNGEVFVLSQVSATRGDGGIGSSFKWSKVMENATTSLSNVTVARGTSTVGFALKSDGTIWTWGEGVYLGNGTLTSVKNYATPMTIPTGITGIKMIQATSDNIAGSDNYNISYYVLGLDKKLYSLGCNSSGQLGDRTSITRAVWVNAKNPDNTIINDVAWISSNEHDDSLSGIALIKTNGVVYTGGNNSYYMIGRIDGGAFIYGGVNYLDIPTGINSTDVITYVETGGHTCALIKQCSSKYGYVGHRIRGSIGDGSSTDETIPSYDFTAPPAIAVCGAQYVLPTITSNGSICPGQDVIFNIIGAAGDVLTYTINSGVQQTVTINNSGQAQIVINNVSTNQILNFTHILSSVNCSYDIAITSSVLMNVPQFTQIPPVCYGEQINPLPTTSNNGFTGSWSPSFNNTETTQYTFTPTNGSCLTSTQMTIVVKPKLVPIFSVFDPLCFGDNQFVLPTTSNNGITGSWSPSLNTSQSSNYLFTPDNNQCATTTVEQVPIQEDFDFELNSYCQGKELIFKVIPIGFTIATANFQWIYNNVNVSTESEFNFSNYITTSPPVFPISFQITIRNENNCQKTKVITVDNINCDIPNTITPNNDGWNDSFDLSTMNVKKILIYNRWGALVYDKEKYLNEWHGQANSGKQLPNGVYFYILEFSDNTPKNGWILLNN